MRVWEEWVWLAGGQSGERGVWGERGEGYCGRREGGGGLLSNLGVHFGVWKTVGLFQLECNISTETLPLYDTQSSDWREAIDGGAIFQSILKDFKSNNSHGKN